MAEYERLIWTHRRQKKPTFTWPIYYRIFQTYLDGDKNQYSICE